MSSCIHLIIQSVRFQGGIVKPKDEIRISVTSLPSHGKDHFIIPASKLGRINHEFVINCELNMQAILILVRRKSYINGDPILGGNKIGISKIPSDRPLDSVIDLKDVLTVNDKDHIQKVTGSMAIRLYYDDNDTAPAPKEPAKTPHFEPVPSFQPAASQPPIAPQNSNGTLPLPPPHHSRRKSLMPKWKKNDHFIGFSDQVPVSQPLANTHEGVLFKDTF